MAVTREDIIAAYHLVLGREPESEQAIEYHMQLGFEDRFILGTYMACTDEFRRRLDGLVQTGRAPAPAHAPASARPKTVFLGDRVLTETHRGQKIYVVPTDVDLTPHIMWHGLWEPHVEQATLALLRPGQRAADIGANIGYHTIAMAAAVGGAGRIEAFEANPEILRLLTATVFVNGLSPIVRLHHRAVMDAPGTITLASTPDHYGSGNVVPDHFLPGYDEGYPTRVQVPAVTLDGALGDDAVLDLIRIDIEGSEPLALRGATRLIDRSPQLKIVSEWSVGMMSARASVPEFVDWLAGLGFRFWRITPGSAALEPLEPAATLNLPHSDVVIARELPG